LRVQRVYGLGLRCGTQGSRFSVSEFLLLIRVQGAGLNFV
jgi:hypothetical protein